MPIRGNLKDAVKNVIEPYAGFDEADSIVVNDFHNRKTLKKKGDALVSSPGTPITEQVMEGLITQTYEVIISAEFVQRDHQGALLATQADDFKAFLEEKLNYNRGPLWSAFGGGGSLLSVNFNWVRLGGEPQTVYADDGQSVTINASVLVNVTRRT